MPHLSLRRAFAFASFALALPALSAAQKLDLNRITPVPASEPIPVMDFFRAPFLEQPKLNPSGTHVAALVSAGEDHTNLMVFGLAKKSIEALALRGDSDVSGVDWLGDKRLLFNIGVKKFAQFTLAVGEVGSLHNSYPVLQNCAASLIAVPPQDRQHPLAHLRADTEMTGRYGEVVTFETSVATGKLLDLSIGRLDSKMLDETTENNTRHITRRHPVLETPDGFDLFYLADKDGRLEFGVSSTHGIRTLHHLVGNRWERCPEDLDQINVLSTGDEPGEIVVLGPRQEGKGRALEILKAVDGTQTEVLLQDNSYDFDGWLYRDPVSHRIVGAHFDRAAPDTVWFSEDYRNLQKAVNRLFPGLVARIIGNDEAGKLVLISAFSDRQPPIYNYVDLEKRTVSPIQNSRPWIDPARMQPTGVVKYKTRDGRKLDAYLTLPAGATKAKPVPVVVIPPENSHSRVRWQFDSEAQFFASRGYAVFQPNHRGSEGYAGAFPVDDDWDYAKIREDVADAVRSLLATRLVDPQRVAIMGTGFGGYLAVAGAAYHPELFRCVVAISPTCDWADVLKDQAYNRNSGAYYDEMVRKLGDPKKEPAKFDAIAPVRHANKIKAAVLIAHGEYDLSVSIANSKRLVAAVRQNGLLGETTTYLNEAYGLRHLQNLVDFYGQAEAFLAANLRPN